MSSSAESSPPSSPRASPQNASFFARFRPDSFEGVEIDYATAPTPIPVLDADKEQFNRFMSVEDDLLADFGRRFYTQEMEEYLWRLKSKIESEAAYHAHLGPGDLCRVAFRSSITHSRFNVNADVNIVKNGCKEQFRVRIPIPLAHNEFKYPGSIEEKIRIDVGSYLWWINHMGIPTSELVGFGMPDGGPRVTHKKYLSPLDLVIAELCESQIPNPDCDFFLKSNFVNRGSTNGLPFGYLMYRVMDETAGTSLSEIMALEEDNVTQDAKIIRSVAALNLELANIPFNRIGTFMYQDDGFVTLSGRPLVSSMTIMELNGADRLVSSGVFTNTEDFLIYMLDLHDSRFLNQRNAVSSETDAQCKMSLNTFMRDIAPEFVCPGYNLGPFFVQMIDLDINHLLVDSNRNITAILDLEWMSVLPIEVTQEVAWLTGMLVEKEGSGEYLSHAESRQIWLDIFREEETALRDSGAMPPDRANTRLGDHLLFMNQSRGLWFASAIMSHNGLYNEVFQHLAQRLPYRWGKAVMDVLVTRWNDILPIVQQKLEDYTAYMYSMREFCRRRRLSSLEDMDYDDSDDDHDVEEVD